MKILITGSKGLVGSEAVYFFKEKGWEVVGVDRNIRSELFGVERSNDEFLDNITIPIDIRDQVDVESVFKNHKFDVIIHAAAQPSHHWSEKEPLTDFDINARGTLILLEATRKYCPDATFVFCSSDKVYGMNPGKELWDESISVDQTMHTPFGCSKMAADLYVQEYGKYFGMNTVCFRGGCITGKRHKGSNWHGFLANVARCGREDDMFPIYGDGNTVRDNIHSYDLVNAFWYFIQNPKKGEVYNIGGGSDRSVSVLGAIDLVNKELGKKMKVEYKEEHRADRRWDVHDISKFRKDYPDWNYKYSLNDIIKELCES